MFDNYQFGYPEIQRVKYVKEAVKRSTENYRIEYHGKYRPIPIVEIRIEVPVYRMENVRTKNLQKEWLAQHPDLSRDILTADPFSIEAQEIQHQILSLLADKEGLMSSFKGGSLQQTEPIICSDNGIVVNGNRRLCAWRNLFYSNKDAYKHFETIRVAVLPDHDSGAMYDLEVALQIHSDMKSDYTWHAIAADCKEKAERGMEIKDIASKQGKPTEEILTYIECYDYAAEYLESIGHADEWSHVDKQYFAFRQIVKSRKSLSTPGDKALFREIVKSMLQVPAKGERLYGQIPKVAKNLDIIAPKLKQVFEIEEEDGDEGDEDLRILGGNDLHPDINTTIAAGVRNAGDPSQVVNTIKAVLDSKDELEKEKKNKSFVFDQIKKASTYLTNAVSNLNDSMIKDGVEAQIKNIEARLTVLKDWVKE